MNKGSLNEKDINDAKDFTLLDNAMNAVGITLTQKSDIYRVTAAVLHLGNVEFQENISDKKGAFLSIYGLFFNVLQDKP